jgi:hypothetical protein
MMTHSDSFFLSQAVRENVQSPILRQAVAELHAGGHSKDSYEL